MAKTDPAPVDVFPDEPAVQARTKTWALEVDGFVADMLRLPLGQLPEFKKEPDGSRVLDVTGVRCAVGYIVDNKGNVAPSEGREEPLLPHEPAYHDRSNPDAAHTLSTAATMSTAEQPEIKDKRKPVDGVAVAEGSQKPIA
jgi:hypothetical protein